MKALYRRLVNAITMWLLNHMVFDFSYVTCLAQLKYLWENCPEDHLIVIVRQIGLPDQKIDINSEIVAIVNHPPLNEMGDPESLATILGYGYAILSTTSPQSGMAINLFNPGRHHERGINPNLDGEVEHWFHNDYDSRQTIVGWRYVPISKDEPKAE